MRQYFTVILFILCASCSPAPKQAAAIATPRNTATASPVPSPTIDAVATAQSEANAARLDAVAAQEQAAQARMDAIAAQETAQAADVARLILTATLGAQEIERARINAEIGAVAATRKADDYKEWQAKARATQDAPRLLMEASRAQTEASIAPAREVIKALLWPMVIVCGFALSLYTLHKWAQPRPIVYENNICEDEKPIQPRIWERTKPNEWRDTTPPIDGERFTKYAEYALADNPLGINTVERVLVVVDADGKSHALIPRTEYIQVTIWMQDHKFQELRDNAIRLSVAGREFMTRWIDDTER